MQTLLRLTANILVVATLAGPALGQMEPRNLGRVALAGQPVLYDDRGSLLEVYLETRISQGNDVRGQAVIQAVKQVSAQSPLSPLQQGVVFNRGMRQYGYVAGEIAFKLKGAQSAISADALYAGSRVKRLGNSTSIYIATTTSMAEFLQTANELKARAEVEWVEPAVNYRLGPPVVSSATDVHR